jgi:hypothetical protein
MRPLTDIGLVDELDPVCYKGIRDNKKIQFQKQFPLSWGIMLGEPMIPRRPFASLMLASDANPFD